jgi:hypothetical protein
MKTTTARCVTLAAVALLCFANAVEARDLDLSPANTRFVLNGAIRFDASHCRAQWIIRTGPPQRGKAKVTIANQFESKRCQELTTTGLPWKVVAAGPHTYLILGVSLGDGCGPGDVRVNLVNGVSHISSDIDSCFIRGSFDSTPKLSIVVR